MILTTVVIMSVPGQTVHLTVPSQHLLIITIPPLPTPPGEEGSKLQLKQGWKSSSCEWKCLLIVFN